MLLRVKFQLIHIKIHAKFNRRTQMTVISCALNLRDSHENLMSSSFCFMVSVHKELFETSNTYKYRRIATLLLSDSLHIYKRIDRHLWTLSPSFNVWMEGTLLLTFDWWRTRIVVFLLLS